MRFLTLLLVLLFSTTAWPGHSAEPLVLNYHPFFKAFYGTDGSLLAAIRQYNRGPDGLFLVLDPYRFELHEMAAASVLSARTAGEETWRETPFFQALARHTSPPHPLQNDGLREAEHSVRGVFLTADLCPSKNPLDRRFVEATTSLPQKPPIPLALMVSGLWIQKHKADFDWLKDQVAAGRIAATWVNHSATHPYAPSAPLERNFLLAPKTDFTEEVLSLEKTLLEHGLLPAPFFRFPGLVSDRRLIESLRDLCLIPIGSNAWLAKGEPPREGSIILVHANGNEPEGIRLLLAFYDSRRNAFRRGETALLPLRDAFQPPR